MLMAKMLKNLKYPKMSLCCQNKTLETVDFKILIWLHP